MPGAVEAQQAFSISYFLFPTPHFPRQDLNSVDQNDLKPRDPHALPSKRHHSRTDFELLILLPPLPNHGITCAHCHTQIVRCWETHSVPGTVLSYVTGPFLFVRWSLTLA